MISYLIDNPITVATFLSAVAACFSAFATWHGPRAAAMISERMRKDSELEGERRRMKIYVFATLMQERATIASFQSVQMLNSIDFVFHNSPEVREAWADLYSQFSVGNTHYQLQDEKMRVLLKAMAKEIGFSETLKVDDISRIYYPNALAQQEELDRLQREQALLAARSQLSPKSSEKSFELDEALLRKFPPKPET